MNTENDTNAAALLAQAELAEIQARNQAWDKLTPLQKLELRAEHAQAFLLAFKPTDEGELEKQKIKVAMDDIDALRKFKNGYGQQFLQAKANKRERKQSTKQRKQDEREDAKAQYLPAIAGKSDGRLAQPVQVFLSSFSSGILRYKNLNRWESTFELYRETLGSPPEFKGAVTFGNFVVPVVSQLIPNPNGKSKLALFAIDDPGNVRILATGRLVGNNDILRFEFVHRDAIVDCMSTKPDPDRRDIPGPLPLSDGTRRAFAGLFDAEGRDNDA
jgi:hypothetical protein